MNENIEKQRFKEGDTVLATYGFNNITKKPFRFLYDFGYYTEYGAVVYNHDERNMQDSYAFKLKQLEVPTKEQLKECCWGY